MKLNWLGSHPRETSPNMSSQVSYIHHDLSL
jgi:hypothetical protein